MGWLTHILSEADHRLNWVRDWAARWINELSQGETFGDAVVKTFEAIQSAAAAIVVIAATSDLSVLMSLHANFYVRCARDSCSSRLLLVLPSVAPMLQAFNES